MLFADQRTPVDRLELALPWGDPAVDAALKLGFEVVSRRVGRLDDGRDEVLLDRLRSSFIPCEPPLMTLPPRSAEPLPDFTWRGLTERDAAEVRALSLGASALAGTLQVPSANTAYYAERHANTPAGHQIRVMASAHGLIGIVGAHPTEYQGVFSLGMTIGERWQGRAGGPGGWRCSRR